MSKSNGTTLQIVSRNDGLVVMTPKVPPTGDSFHGTVTNASHVPTPQPR